MNRNSQDVEVSEAPAGFDSNGNPLPGEHSGNRISFRNGRPKPASQGVYAARIFS